MTKTDDALKQLTDQSGGDAATFLKGVPDLINTAATDAQAESSGNAGDMVDRLKVFSGALKDAIAKLGQPQGADAQAQAQAQTQAQPVETPPQEAYTPPS